MHVTSGAFKVANSVVHIPALPCELLTSLDSVSLHQTGLAHLLTALHLSVGQSPIHGTETVPAKFEFSRYFCLKKL